MAYNSPVASVTSTIALGVLSNFATDLIRWAAGQSVEPLDQAIRSTANSFPELEGIEDTLKQWLRSSAVSEAIGRYVLGQSGVTDLSIPALASELVSNTGFYLAEHSHAAAEKILSVFLAKLRTAYLVSPLGPLHIANRQEAEFDSVKQLLQQLNTSVESAGGLKSALQTHFDQALERMDHGDFPGSKVLFQSLLLEIERSPVRDRALERRAHASLGHTLASLGENSDAIRHYRTAVELDDDVVRAAVNAAAADLTEDKPEEALRTLESVPDDTAASSAYYEFSAAKVGTLLRLGRNQDALKLALSIKAPGKEARRLDLIGAAHRQSGNLVEAEKAYREAHLTDSSRPELQYSLAEVLFSPVVEYRNANPGTPLPADLNARLAEAGDLLAAAATTFRTQGRNRAASEINSALALVRLLQDRPQETIASLEPIVTTPDATANDWRNLASAYIFTNQAEKATDAFRSAMKFGDDENTEFLLTHALIMAGRPDEALAIASGKSTEPMASDNLKWHVTKVRALVSMRQFSKAANAIAAVQEQFSADVGALLMSAELNETIGNDSAANEAYEQALRNATGADEVRVRYAFGGFSASRKNFARAVELWKPLVDRTKPGTLLDNYARALYNSRNLQELASIAADVKKSGGKPSASFAEVAAASYQRLDDLQEATYWLEYVCSNYGIRPDYIVQLANVKLRLGQRAEAIELLDASKATLKGPKDIMAYAQAYSLLERHRDALELATHAVRSAEDPEIHMASIGVFLAAHDNVEKTPEEIAVHQDVLAKFKERFPESKLLQSFTIDPEHPLDAIRGTLEEHAKQAQEVVATYRSRRMPLHMFGELLGKDIYDTWFAIISTPDLALLSAGTVEEVAEAQRPLETATGFIIDPVALFTFCYLGFSTAIQSIGDVYVVQRTLDYLHEIQAKRRVTDSGTMGMVDGQFFIHEFTPEQSEKKNAALACAVAWVEKEAKLIGLKEPLTKDEKKWLKILGPANVATIAVARQRGMVLLTDDKNLGDIAKQNYGVSSVNTQSVLLYLHRRNHLTKREYDRCVVKLLEAGYTTSVDEAQLFEVILEEQFQVTPRLMSALRVLEPAVAPLGAVCSIAAGLIRRIFLEAIPDEMRTHVVFSILDMIANNHPKLEVQRLVRGFLRQQMRPLLVLQLRKVEQLLDRW